MRRNGIGSGWVRRGAIAALSLVATVSLALAAPAPRPLLQMRGTRLSEVIYPEQTIPLRFSHAVHGAKLGLACTSCHAAALTSHSSLDRLLPREKVCRRCHAIDRAHPTKAVPAGAPPARCDACHLGASRRGAKTTIAPVVIPEPNLKFDHAAHAARGIRCAACHGDFAARRVTLATRAELPSMARCLGCHDGRHARKRCTVCHLAAAGGRVRTRYPQGELVPTGSLHGDAHDATFRTEHRFAAQNNQGYCRSCHAQAFCVRCHEGEIKPMSFHPGDYIALHPIDARRNQPECGVCHRRQTFCVGCHSRSGVTADGRGSQFVGPSMGDGPRFHPFGWTHAVGGAAPLHGIEARRNLRECTSCHRESFCTRCHSAEQGAMHINPHPPGWAGSRRCEALFQRDGRMCLRCHTDPRQEGCNWRATMR